MKDELNNMGDFGDLDESSQALMEALLDGLGDSEIKDTPNLFVALAKNESHEDAPQILGVVIYGTDDEEAPMAKDVLERGFAMIVEQAIEAPNPVWADAQIGVVDVSRGRFVPMGFGSLAEVAPEVAAGMVDASDIDGGVPESWGGYL
jgi:hypothetical protein